MNISANFFLRAKEEHFRSAVAIANRGISSEFYKHAEKAVDALAEWAGRTLFRKGYSGEVKDLKLSLEEGDYRSRLSVSVFLTSEKHDDVRGFILDVMEAAQAQISTNDIQAERIADLTRSEAFFATTIGKSFKGMLRASAQRRYTYFRGRLQTDMARAELDKWAARKSLKRDGLILIRREFE